MSSARSTAETTEGRTQPAPALTRNCDGKEQYAFEAWAKDHGMNMAEHPLHYLFIDPKTDAARQAWNECIRYCGETAALAVSDAAEGSLNLARAIINLARKEELSTHVEVSFEPSDANLILHLAEKLVAKASGAQS